MKADVRYCSICMLNSMIREMDLFDAPEALQKREFNAFLKHLPDQGDETPVAIQDAYISRLHQLAGYDFYREQREKDDLEMLQLSGQVEKMINESEDPFVTAMKFAIFGNLIDPAGQSDKTAEDVLKEAADTPLAIDDSVKLKEKLTHAENVMYIADNAGEVAMDKLFVEYLMNNVLPDNCQIYFGVRGAQVHNDARETDAAWVGLDKLCTIVNPENTYAGAIIEKSSETYQEAYRKADIVISKGMGNYETLEERTDKTICFLLVAKCIPISSHLKVPKGMPVCKMI